MDEHAQNDARSSRPIEMSMVAGRLTLDDVKQFHALLLTLADSGVSFDLGFVADHQRHDVVSPSLANQLDAIFAKLGLQVGLGRTVFVGLSQDAISERYRTSLLTWFLCDQNVTSLDALHKPTQEKTHLANQFVAAAIGLMILVVLLIAAFAYALVNEVPSLLGMYAQNQIPIPSNIQYLNSARKWLPVWSPVVVIAFAVCLFLIRRMAIWLAAMLSPSHSTSSESNTSDMRFCLVSDIANASAGYAELARQSILSPLAPDDTPLMRWANAIAQSSVGRSNAFLFASRFYRSQTIERIRSRTEWMHVVIATSFGGVLVLGFALTLFVPMIQLLMSLIAP